MDSQSFCCFIVLRVKCICYSTCLNTWKFSLSPNIDEAILVSSVPPQLRSQTNAFLPHTPSPEDSRKYGNMKIQILYDLFSEKFSTLQLDEVTLGSPPSGHFFPSSLQSRVLILSRCSLFSNLTQEQTQISLIFS